MPKIVFVVNYGDPCLRGIEQDGLYELFGLPDVIPVRNPTYYGNNNDDDSDTDEEFESKALVMGPHSSTIEFILDHILRHGMSYVEPSVFQERLHPFAEKANILDLYNKVFSKYYGNVRSIDYDMGPHSEENMGGHVGIPDGSTDGSTDGIPVATAVGDSTDDSTDDIPVVIPVATRVDGDKIRLTKKDIKSVMDLLLR